MAKYSRANTRAAKVNMDTVRAIRRKYAEGTTQSALCREYMISIAQIGRIVRGESWQSVEDTPDLSTAADIAAQARRLAALQELKDAGELDAGCPPGEAETLARFHRDTAATAEGMLKELSAETQDRLSRLKGEKP